MHPPTQSVEHPEGDGVSEDKKEDARNFECNICLEIAKDAVVTMCGHLFCWACLHQWLENRTAHDEDQVCPVCKVAISKETVVPLYGRDSTRQEDPRKKAPPRPSGQREEPELGASPLGLLLRSAFNFRDEDARAAPRGSRQHMEQLLPKFILWLALILVAWVILGIL